MFTFLRALGLEPIEWDQAVRETGTGSPHNLDAVRAAMEIGQAVVVLLTPEDQAGLLPEFANGDEDDVLLRGQPRQNVILEAGLAMGIDGSRVILVELGRIRRPSDFDGLNTVRLTNSAPSRMSLRTRLETAECAVSEVGSDWTRPEAGGDFDAAVVTVEPHPPE
jgi:predicted nucleotide-binding protein